MYQSFENFLQDVTARKGEEKERKKPYFGVIFRRVKPFQKEKEEWN